MSLTRRVERLENGTAPVGGMLLHWEIPEDAQALECHGQRFIRHTGECLSAFIDRVAHSMPLHGLIWIDAPTNK